MFLSHKQSVIPQVSVTAKEGVRINLGSTSGADYARLPRGKNQKSLNQCLAGVSFHRSIQEIFSNWLILTGHSHHAISIANHVTTPENKTFSQKWNFESSYILEFKVGYVLPETITRTECKRRRNLLSKRKTSCNSPINQWSRPLRNYHEGPSLPSTATGSNGHTAYRKTCDETMGRRRAWYSAHSLCYI
jgi:hypothetical protein